MRFSGLVFQMFLFVQVLELMLELPCRKQLSPQFVLLPNGVATFGFTSANFSEAFVACVRTKSITSFKCTLKIKSPLHTNNKNTIKYVLL